MKKLMLLITLFYGFLTTSICAQETIWLDKDLQQIKKQDAVYYKIGNKLEGEVSYFYKNTNIYKKFFLADGKPEGKYAEYYESGELKAAGKYKDDAKDGNWKEYYKTGKIKEKGRYSQGEKVGIWKVFYKND
jgi:antitoxin component YwqK of YwqJK toxin-antitoxin module